MPRKTMASLYNSEKVKALVSCSRGEGFGLPMIEAAAAGLPVMATDWSAHTEFLNLGRWIKFDYELSPVSQNRVDNNIIMPGAQWAEVQEKDFKKKMRKFYEGDQVPRKWAQDLSLKIKENYGWKNIMRIYDDALSEIIL